MTWMSMELKCIMQYTKYEHKICTNSKLFLLLGDYFLRINEQYHITELNDFSITSVIEIW